MFDEKQKKESKQTPPPPPPSHASHTWWRGTMTWAGLPPVRPLMVCSRCFAHQPSELHVISCLFRSHFCFCLSHWNWYTLRIPRGTDQKGGVPPWNTARKLGDFPTCNSEGWCPRHLEHTVRQVTLHGNQHKPLPCTHLVTPWQMWDGIKNQIVQQHTVKWYSCY